MKENYNKDSLAGSSDTEKFVVHAYGRKQETFGSNDAETGLDLIASALKKRGWQPLSESNLNAVVSQRLDVAVNDKLGENPQELIIDTTELTGRAVGHLREKLEACLIREGLLRRTWKSISEPVVYNAGAASLGQNKAVLVANSEGQLDLNAIVTARATRANTRY